MPTQSITAAEAANKQESEKKSTENQPLENKATDSNNIEYKKDVPNPHGFTEEQDKTIMRMKTDNAGTPWVDVVKEVGKPQNLCMERFKLIKPDGWKPANAKGKGNKGGDRAANTKEKGNEQNNGKQERKEEQRKEEEKEDDAVDMFGGLGGLLGDSEEANMGNNINNGEGDAGNAWGESNAWNNDVQGTNGKNDSNENPGWGDTSNGNNGNNPGWGDTNNENKGNNDNSGDAGNTWGNGGWKNDAENNDNKNDNDNPGWGNNNDVSKDKPDNNVSGDGGDAWKTAGESINAGGITSTKWNNDTSGDGAWNNTTMNGAADSNNFGGGNGAWGAGNIGDGGWGQANAGNDGKDKGTGDGGFGGWFDAKDEKKGSKAGSKKSSKHSSHHHPDLKKHKHHFEACSHDHDDRRYSSHIEANYIVSPDDDFSGKDLRIAARILKQDESQVWERLSWRFRDKTGRNLHPDIFEKKFTGKVAKKER